MEMLETKVLINDIEVVLKRVAQYEGVAVKGVVVAIGEFTETFDMDVDDEVARSAANAVAVGVYGQYRTGGVKCSNSEFHEILGLMRQVAGV